jgi:beta-lactam-binding protein with PASTA domain
VLCRKAGAVFLTTAVLLFLVLPGAVFAQGKPDGVVQAGSVDNQFEVTVSNPSAETAVDDLSLTVAERSEWITNIRIEPDNSGALAPGASRKYTIRFDVKEDAEAGVIERVKFRVSTDIGLIDSPDPGMAVKIEKAAGEGAGPSPVLQLVKIQGPTPGHQTPGYSEPYDVSYRKGDRGFTAVHRSRYFPDWIQALRITSVPLEITLGEAFEFSAEVKKRKIHEPGERCFARKDGAILYPARTGYRKETDHTLQSPRMSVEPGNARIIGRDDLHVYCPSNDTATPEGRVVDALVEKEGVVSVRVIFTPERVEVDEGVLFTERTYHYRIDYVTDGKLEGARGGSDVIRNHTIVFKKDIDNNGYLSPEEEPSDNIHLSPFHMNFAFEISEIAFNYDVLHQDSARIASLPDYQWPGELVRPPRDERGEAGDTSVAEADGSLSDPEAAGPGSDTGETGEGDRDEEVRGETLDPARLDPRSGRVAPLIRKWISIAEPPENATRGAAVRYDQWGRKVGKTADGGVITASGKPGYARGSPEETVWAIRKKLDSVNHCTLEEFVVAGLQERSTRHCRGRYKAPEPVIVADLSGLPLSEAKKVLTGAGLIPRLVAGEPAASSDLEGTIASQKPAAGTELQPGKSVTIKIYGPYNPMVTVSDLSGLSLTEAKARLEAKGLKSQMAAAGPAPSQDLSYRIKETDPKPGTRVKPGTGVTLKVFSKYRTAASAVTVPSVVGLTFEQAGQRLEAAGLAVKRGEEVTPEKQQLQGMVRSQVPKAGSKTSRGASVELVVYGEYVAETKPYTSQQKVAEADCSRYPRSKPYWDSKAKVVKCGCQAGLRWNLDKTACVTELEYARQYCAANRPGSIAVKRADGGYKCVCPTGYVWDNNIDKCKILSTPPVNRNDLTGKWSGGKKIITKEGGYYICRLYSPPPAYTKGYQRGMIVLKFNASPGPSSTYHGKYLYFRYQESPIWVNAVIEHIKKPRTKREDLKINYEYKGKKTWIRFGRFIR